MMTNEKILKTVNSLKDNNMEAVYFEKREEAMEYIDNFIKDDDTVSVGGSQTLFQLGIIDYLRNRKVTFLDRYKSGLSGKEIDEVFRKTFYADVFLTSSNAVTEDGFLLNVDGRGNRIAAMLFGPKKVLVIAGVNKIVKDLDEAEERIRKVAAPSNAVRLNKNTPCTKTGECMDCDSPDRLCREYAVIKKPNPGRIYVLLVNEELGF